MHQILHIFRKDLRHLYPEAILCLVVTAAWARLYPAEWLPEHALPFGVGAFTSSASLQTIVNILTALVPISWFVLIIRVVQDESLVGERPYWFTRPYDWRKLLAAKLVFLGLFVVLPLGIAQCVLVKEAGFPPTQHVAQLLGLLVCCAGTFVLPMLCLATITKNFLRAALTVLGLVVLAVAAAAVSSAFDASSISTPGDDLVSPALYFIVLAGVVVSQYASRRTWLARSLLVALAVTISVLTWNPFETRMLENTFYPGGGAAFPLALSLAAPGESTHGASFADDSSKRVELHVPVAVAGVPYGYTIEPDDLSLRLIAPDGTTWVSPWQVLYNHSYRPETEQGDLTFKLPRAVLDHIRKVPVRLELSLAVSQLEEEAPARFIIPATGDLAVPGIGLCTHRPDPGEDNHPTLHCRYALSKPHRTLVTASFSPDPCPADGSAPPRSYPKTATIGSLNPDSFELTLPGVSDDDLSFGYQGSGDTPTYPAGYLCPGAALSFAKVRLVRRGRYNVTLNDVLIAEPQKLDIRSISIGTP